MKADPLVPPGPWGGNHATWVAGHLAVNEGRLHKMLRGTPNPVEHWKPLSAIFGHLFAPPSNFRTSDRTSAFLADFRGSSIPTAEHAGLQSHRSFCHRDFQP
jgi:hypothetical protein